MSIRRLQTVSLALGVVFWLVGNHAPLENDAMQE